MAQWLGRRFPKAKIVGSSPIAVGPSIVWFFFLFWVGWELRTGGGTDCFFLVPDSERVWWSEGKEEKLGRWTVVKAAVA